MAQNGSAASASVPSEGVLLSQLIQLLSQRPRHTLLLSDLAALLPGALRQRAEEQGGLNIWISRYPSLFTVSGAPGKEALTLILGSPAAVQSHTAAAVAAAAASQQAVAGNDANGGASGYEGWGDMAHGDYGGYLNDYGGDEGGLGGDGGNFDEDVDGLCALQLRGLPYKATAEDVRSFLGDHAEHLQQGENPIYLVLNRDGRPSGFARVTFETPEAAMRCRDDLHLRSMEDRYVEVFLYSERPSRGRQRRALQEEASPETARTASAIAAEAAGVTKDHVVRECRTQMADPKKRRLLLSMLGVALSSGARAYLKQMDQGLKHFLAQYPAEFSVEGGKGSEYVSYTPIQLSEAIDGLSLGARAPASSASGLDEILPTSPVREKPSAASMDPTPSGGPCLATPSNWGTPCPPTSGAPWGGPPAVGGWLPPWPTGAPMDALGAAGTAGAAAGANWTPPPLWPMNPAQFWPGLGAGWPGQMPAWDAPPPAIEANAIAAAAAGGKLAEATSDRGSAARGNAASAGNRGDKDAEKAAGKKDTQLATSISTNKEAATGGIGYANAVRLRGLPFSASEQDVLAFFAQHEIVERITDGPNAVTLLLRSNGRPSGQAVVQMRSRADAELAQCVLRGQWMGSRYIEVFLYSEDGQPMEGSGLPAGAAPAATAGGATPASLASTRTPSTLGSSSPAEAASAAAATHAQMQAAAAAAAIQALAMPWAAPPAAWPPTGAPGGGRPFGLEAHLPPADASAAGAATANAHAAAAAAAAVAALGASGGTPSWEALFEFLGQEGMGAGGLGPFGQQATAIGNGSAFPGAAPASFEGAS
eukprot:TRINITY_DN54910_c0_g1_i1.p1 TRINITY_DN54910_c0_g1~~TRINITY_DN54910_c0_g1_i1.p1  ORF type:complete len:874 (-),score=184.99 TRINITY_DN54910_c0_g1_i1:441-2900(-)